MVWTPISFLVWEWELKVFHFQQLLLFLTKVEDEATGREKGKRKWFRKFKKAAFARIVDDWNVFWTRKQHRFSVSV